MQNAGAAAILAKLATRFAAGDQLSVGDIARATGCSTGVAFAVRRWAKASRCWRYAEATGGFVKRQKGGDS